MNVANKTLGQSQIGFFNPGLYSLATSNLHSFNDVITGTNGDAQDYGGIAGYSAGYGYDNTTGWGSMIGYITLLNYTRLPIENGTNPPPQVPDLRPTMITATSVKFAWKRAQGTTAYVAYAQQLEGKQNFMPFLNYKITKGLTTTLTNLLPNQYYVFRTFAEGPGGYSQTDDVFQTAPE